MQQARVAESPPSATVLLVLEAGPECARLRAALARTAHSVVWVPHREAAINVLDGPQVDVLVTRLRGDRIPGLSLLALARKRNPQLAGILIIAPGEDAEATAALGQGAVDFQSPPLNLAKIVAAIEGALEHQRCTQRLRAMSQRLDERFGFPGLLGDSGAMGQVRARLIELSPLDTHVLLCGEPGTGKDLMAGTLHQNSPRRNGPFVKVYCPALSPRLLARELLGAPRSPGGTRRPGRIELAHAGTLYLDEVAALPRDLQARLGEVIRTRQVRAELGQPPRDVDFRVVASTTREWESLLDRGHLDEGFHDLLAESRIDLPPLRHRRRDIRLLARHFLGEFSGDLAPALAIEPAALQCLGRYSWPGNVRELRNLLQEIAAEATAERTIRERDLPDEIRQAETPEGVVRLPLGTSLREAERRLILETLRLCEGNRERAAKSLGMGVRTLYRKIRDYGRSPRRP